MTLLAGLDLGTTTIKAVLFDTQSGKISAVYRQPTPVSHPQPDWSEHDPQLLWEAACRCLRHVASGYIVHALAISSMAEAGVPLNSSGQPVAPAVAWYDRRSAPQSAFVENQLGNDKLFSISGQRVSASFGLTKWLWLRENKPDIADQVRWWLPLPAYILYRLTGIRAVDYSIASRALLFDQNSLDWSPLLLDLAGLRSENLPELASGGSFVGYLTAQAADETGLTVSTRCVLGGHDHLCAAFAAGASHSGTVVDSTGTAEAVVLVTPAFQPDPYLGEHGYACYAHILPGQFVVKAGLKAAGSSIEWLARLLSPSTSEPDYPALEAEARATLGQLGPLWLPHLLESGSPEADPLSRGALVGARLDHHRGDLFRGLLEGLACWLRQNLADLQSTLDIPIETVSLLGGTTRLQLLNQIKACVLNRPVQVALTPEAAAVGAALLAGMGSGVFNSSVEALSSLSYTSLQVEPDPVLSSTYEHVYRQAYLPLYQSLREIHHHL